MQALRKAKLTAVDVQGNTKLAIACPGQTMRCRRHDRPAKAFTQRRSRQQTLCCQIALGWSSMSWQ